MTERPRPQTPRPPFPYHAEEVAYDNAAAKVRLAGTLLIPDGAGPFPAALLITGSGPQDRDESLLGHKPFLPGGGPRTTSRRSRARSRPGATATSPPARCPA